MTLKIVASRNREQYQNQANISVLKETVSRSKAKVLIAATVGNPEEKKRQCLIHLGKLKIALQKLQRLSPDDEGLKADIKITENRIKFFLQDIVSY